MDLPLTDEVADRRRGDEQLRGHRAAPTVGGGDQLLGHDALQRRGQLHPDLLLLISPQAVALIDHGLIDPLPSRDPEIASLLRLISPVDLTRVRTRKGIAGLPVFSEFTLACYNKRHLNQPPASLSELLAVAASGRTVGLSVDASGLWWTAGAMGAQQVMTPIITGQVEATPTNTADITITRPRPIRT